MWINFHLKVLYPCDIMETQSGPFSKNIYDNRFIFSRIPLKNQNNIEYKNENVLLYGILQILVFEQFTRHCSINWYSIYVFVRVLRIYTYKKIK